MFEFLFKYPSTVFAKGRLVLLSGWPAWLLAVLMLAAAVALAVPIARRYWRTAEGMPGSRPIALWLLQSSLAALLLWVLWHPALSVATLRPQQNVVAVVVDDSRSMAFQDHGLSRRDQVLRAVQPRFLDDLRKRFQVRMYRLGENLTRFQKLEQLTAAEPATRLGNGLREVVAEGTSVPVGAVVLLSDGSDNAEGIDLETMSEIRRLRIPVHTVGFGREVLARDVELRDVQIAPRALPESRLEALVTLTQRGYAGHRARLVVRDASLDVRGKPLASQEVTLKQDGQTQTESVPFNAGPAGAKTLAVSLEPLEGEEATGNNTLTQLLSVDLSKPRILYIEGEPRWEYKFIHRAATEDASLELISMLRTTQNKIYRQGIRGPQELEQGFPIKVEDLFSYQGLIVGGVESGYFSATQQELIRQFADRRGGGVLFLAGRTGLSDGGYGTSALAEMLPVTLPSGRNTFHRDQASVELTAAGRDSLLLRLEDDPTRSSERWKKMPALANYQEIGSPKPGAQVLAEVVAPGGRGRSPFLVTQRYGRGRVAVLASGGTWRWQMLQESSDRSHETFWKQVLRHLVTETPGQVELTTNRQILSSGPDMRLRAEVRDKSFQLLSDAQPEVQVLSPDGSTERVELRPDPQAEGVFTADWSAKTPGAYVATLTVKRGAEEIGRDATTFRREVGTAENFRLAQNRELLERLSAQTGGKYYKPTELAKLAEDVAYSEAGLSSRENRDLWDMPIVFLAAVGLRAAEWLLRRRWGAV